MTSGVRRESFPGDLEGTLWSYRSRANVVALWRQRASRSGRWIYLARLSPSECALTLIRDRFGGGYYRAKIYGAWNSGLRYEVYLKQVSFAIAGPPTSETRSRIQRPGVSRARSWYS